MGPRGGQRSAHITGMASSESTYDERLGLVDCFEEYKEYFSQQHYKLLVHEALEGKRGGVGKLKYVLALARRCKTGAVSVELLANNIDQEYSLTPLRQHQQAREEEGKVMVRQKGGEAREGVAGYEDVDTEIDEPGQQNVEEQNKEEEEEEEEEGGRDGVLETFETSTTLVNAIDRNKQDHGRMKANKGGQGELRVVLQGDVNPEVTVVDMQCRLEGAHDNQEEQMRGSEQQAMVGSQKGVAEIVDVDDDEGDGQENQQEAGGEQQVRPQHCCREIAFAIGLVSVLPIPFLPLALFRSAFPS